MTKHIHIHLGGKAKVRDENYKGYILTQFSPTQEWYASVPSSAGSSLQKIVNGYKTSAELKKKIDSLTNDTAAKPGQWYRAVTKVELKRGGKTFPPGTKVKAVYRDITGYLTAFPDNTTGLVAKNDLNIDFGAKITDAKDSKSKDARGVTPESLAKAKEKASRILQILSSSSAASNLIQGDLDEAQRGLNNALNWLN